MSQRGVVQAYPLAWPAGWERTPAADRRRGFFSRGERQYFSQPGGSSWMRYLDLSVADAVGRVLSQLERMGVIRENIVISTNLRVRLDGLPRSGQRAPEDPGAAVYWEDNTVDGWPRRCMAVDLYDRVEHNLAALAATLDAMRTIDRHGGAEILDRAFTGFTALPPPVVAQKPWREVLGCQGIDHAAYPIDVVKGSYLRERSKAHPDKGGSQEQFLAVQAAYEQAARELGFQP